MKKVMFIYSTILLSMGLFRIIMPMDAIAVDVDSEKTKSEVSFIPGNGITTPLDPENPDQPVVPGEPIDPKDPNNNGTGESGSLTVDYISNIKFGKRKVSDTTQIYESVNHFPHIQVTDTRGTGEGWSVTASASKLTGINKDGEEVTLKGAVLSLTNGIVKTQSANTSKAPIANDVIFDNSFEKLLFHAPVDAGEGTWLDVFANQDATLKVFPRTAQAGVKYSGKLTWTLSDAPQ